MSEQPTEARATFWLLVNMVVVLASLAAMGYGAWHWVFSGGGVIFQDPVWTAGWLMWIAYEAGKRWALVGAYDFNSARQGPPKPEGRGPGAGGR